MSDQATNQNIGEYFQEEFDLELSDDQLEECRQSFYYLGKAIHKYYLLTKEDGKQE